MMFLSIIIPTRNRAKHLSNTLESVARQNYALDMFEVLVIDNGSTDNTSDICASFKNRMPQLRYFYEGTPGLHVGRHLGMKMAKSVVLVYADDDIEALPTWLEGISEAFQDPEVVLVGGKILPNFEEEPPEWISKMWNENNDGNKILGTLSLIDMGSEIKSTNPLHIFGANFSIKKATLIEAGGFHPDAMPDDLKRKRGDGETHVSRYIQAKQYKAVYQPRASVYHSVPLSRMTRQYFRKRFFYQGISDSYTAIRSQREALNSVTTYGKLLKMLASTPLALSTGNIRGLTFQLHYIKGYLYHQKQVARDPDLFAWVLRPTYF